MGSDGQISAGCQGPHQPGPGWNPLPMYQEFLPSLWITALLLKVWSWHQKQQYHLGSH